MDPTKGPLLISVVSVITDKNIGRNEERTKSERCDILMGLVITETTEIKKSFSLRDLLPTHHTIV